MSSIKFVVSERPRYCATEGCSLLHFLAATGMSYAPLGAFSVPVFTTYPTESRAGLKCVRKIFTLGTPRIFSSVVCSFHWCHLCAYFLSTPRSLRVFRHSSAHLILFRCELPDFIPVSNSTACVVWHWHNRLIHVSCLFSLSVSACAK